MVRWKPKLWLQGGALLAPPILFVIWVASGKGVQWIALRASGFQDSLFSANTMVMALVWLGYLMTLINLFFYAFHIYQGAFKRDADIGNRRDLIIVFVFTTALAFVMAIFLTITFCAFFGFLHFSFITIDSVILLNHVLLVVIFVAFILMDWRAFRSARSQDTGLTTELVSAWLSVWLVSVPSLLVTLLAILLHNRILANPDWLLVFDKPEILSGDTYGYLYVPVVNPSSQEEPMFGLFVSGLNTGLIMASIMVSQIAFFAIQVFKNIDLGKNGE